VDLVSITVLDTEPKWQSRKIRASLP
jgi:hypothetical protein